MSNTLRDHASKSDEKVTSDRASTFSSAATLSSDATSEYTLKPDQSEEKEKTGLLKKLGGNTDGFLEKLEAGTPMGRSKALQKELKDTDKRESKNNPTYPAIYVL
jgi:hypothetical protein